MDLVLTNLLGPKFFGGLAGELGKAAHMVRVALDGLRRIVADLHVFDHTLAQKGSWRTLLSVGLERTKKRQTRATNHAR
jgi:hypothetical protein